MEKKPVFGILLLFPIVAVSEVIEGTVVDSFTSQGILRAIVTEKGTSNCDTTDAQGRFSLTIGIGTEKAGVTARGAGFFLSGGRFTWQAEKSCGLQVHSVLGRLLYSRNSGAAAGSILLPDFASGLYIVSVDLDGRMSGHRMVKAGTWHSPVMAGDPEAIRRGAAGKARAAITLEMNRTGYRQREVSAEPGTTDLTARLLTTYPATPSEIGPSTPALLAPSGDIEVGTDGVVIENVHVTGYIHIRDGASNVTVRNFKISGNTYWGIYIREGTSTNILIENGEIDGQDQAEDGIVGSNYTARGVYIHNMAGDGFKAFSNCLIERCYVTAVGQGAGAHGDGVQGPWAAGSYQEIKILNNNFLLNSGSLTACIFTCEYVSHVQVEGNRLSGGSYTVYCSPNHTLINNVFGRDGFYGHRTGDCGTWSGNIWFDTALPVN